MSQHAFSVARPERYHTLKAKTSAAAAWMIFIVNKIYRPGRPGFFLFTLEIPSRIAIEMITHNKPDRS